MRFVVLGDPVDHSLSPPMHNAAFSALELGATYGRCAVDAAGLAYFFDEIRSGRIAGASVTMPHKRLAATLCDDLDALARRAGAVNTLVRAPSGVEGHNTDVTGIRRSWSWAEFRDGPVLVLGAGGAAAAALLALEGRPLSLSARREQAAADLLDRIGVEGNVVKWGSALSGAIVVNATPVGTAGETLPKGVVEAAGGYYEMVYASGETPAERVAATNEIPVVRGVDMLLAQAIDAIELWTGREAPIEAMRRALSGAAASTA